MAMAMTFVPPYHITVGYRVCGDVHCASPPARSASFDERLMLSVASSTVSIIHLLTSAYETL